MTGERLRTGLTVGALGALVLVAVLLAGRFGLAGLPGGFFGAPQADADDRVIVFDGEGLTEAPGAAARRDAGRTPSLGSPVPASPSAPGSFPATAPAPGTDVGRAPEEAATQSDGVTIPDGPAGEGTGDTVGSVVRLASATVNSLGETAGDTVGLLIGFLNPPAQGGHAAPGGDAPATAGPPRLPE